MEEVRSVDKFHGVAVSGDIEVHAETNASVASSLKLKGESDAVSGITTHVDFWGTLLLRRIEGTASGRVVAKVTVPEPLTFVGASTGGTIIADNVSGSVVVSNRARIGIKQLNSTNSTNVVASSYSSISISEGRVPHVSASASDHASIDLGALHATFSSISVSSASSVVNGTVEYGSISVSSGSSIRMNATGEVGISCSESAVHLSGGGRVTQWSNWSCTMNIARRLEAADVLV
uniref:Putative auto-transporter adhesin head GIN domain-containing protein n=1 Tax=Alexandrium andersonii TaxID=327968 RepID=A0A7S2F2U9_9DINO|mmetsp:Transcript_15052/g.33945  ORF Transcript_15052/g.33945 Transcript_15052/m.33945 type:complete len:234 (+) Transcript_15052:1-702(+)